MSWITDKAYAELQRVRDAQAKEIYPYFRAFESGGLHTTIDGKPLVNFSSNDYLGLTNHPKVKEAAKAAVDQFACGLSSSRVQATATMHVELEERLAATAHRAIQVTGTPPPPTLTIYVTRTATCRQDGSAQTKG